MGHHSTEQRVSLGALSITVLSAVFCGCIASDDDLHPNPGVEPGEAESLTFGELASECGWWQPTVRLTQLDPALVEGQQITFFVDYSNRGPGTVSDVRVQTSIPRGTSFVAASAGGAVSGGVVKWNVGTLRAGRGGAASITVVADAAGEFTSAAELRYRYGWTRRLTSSQTVTLDDPAPPDQTPIAIDDSASLAEDGQVVIAVRDNDSGGDGALVVAEVTAPQHGTATIEGGAVRYVPAPDYFGDDSFSYVLRDEDGDTATATVSLAVTAVDDTPAATLDLFTIVEDSSGASFAVLANDLGLGDGPIEIVTITSPSHGTVTLVGDKLLYVPSPNHNGSDAFTYTVRDVDGQRSSTSVFVTVTPVNDAPIARDDSFEVIAGLSTTLSVLANDVDPDGHALRLVSVTAPLFGTAVVTGNQVVFLAPLGILGLSTFSYEVTDGQGAFATATVSLSVL